MAVEKRRKQLGLDDTLKMLNNAQSFALGAFGECGAQLAFVRETEQGRVAVVKTSDSFITIDTNGKVDAHPDIQLRTQ